MAPTPRPRLGPEPQGAVAGARSRSASCTRTTTSWWSTSRPGLLAVPTAPGRDGEDSALARVQEYVARLRPRRPYVGVVHRLDRDTSGALAFALTPAARAAAARSLPRAPHGAALRRARPRLAAGRGGGRSTCPSTTSTRRAGGAWPAPGSPRTRRARTGAWSSASPPAPCSRWSWRRDASTRSACTSPTWACPSWATPSTAIARRRTAAAAPRQMLHARHLGFAHPSTGAPVAAESPLPDGLPARPRPRCARRPRRRRRGARGARRARRCAAARRAAELAQLGMDAVLDPVRVPPLARVHLLAEEDHGEVQVVPRGQARGIALRDDLPARHGVARLDREAGQVSVEGEQAEAVVDHDRVAVDAEVVGQHHHAVVGGRHRARGWWWRGRSRGDPAGRPPCPCRRRCGGRRSWPRPASCRAGGRARATGTAAASAGPSPPAPCCWPRAGRG